MIKKLTLALVATSLGTLALAAPAAAGVDHRQHQQQARIEQGVRTGTLTPAETKQLRHQQTRIARYETRSRADGGGLTRRERANIARMQNNASSNIRRQKHDRQHAR
jgi:hypothetical protein